MKRTFLATLLIFSVWFGASAASIITQWNFNDTDGLISTGTLVPSIGSGTAANVGAVTTTYNQADGSSDPLGPTDPNNTAWRMSGNWPAQGTGNKTCGVQLNISTVGYENITLTWDQANSGSANRYYRVQYSLDGGATWADKDVIENKMGGNFWTNLISVTFATIPGANNNPNFGVRILSEFQSTAVGGSPNYFAVGTGSYGVNGVLRLDMITFSGDAATGEVNILADPTNQVVAVGQPASFQVAAGGGWTTITYQWRKDGSPMGGATDAVYAIASAQHADAASYDVVVANSVNSRTSAVATLTVRDPLGLAWTGLNGTNWDSTTVNWVDTNTAGNVAYTIGDHVLFDSRGASAAIVSLAESVNPSSLTVDANFDYTLRSDASGNVVGASGIRKRGSGTLILNTDNAHTGSTVIEAGTIQVGAADTHGSLGSGAVINGGGLVFNRSDNIVIGNPITSSGGITNYGKSVILSGANTYNGPVASHAGSLVLSGSQVVNSSELFSVAGTATGAGGATKLAIADGMVIGSGTTIRLCGSLAAPDVRANFFSTTGTNIVNGPIVLEGSGNYGLGADGTSELRINGNISWAPGSSASLSLRGVGAGVLNGRINMTNGVVHKTDTSTWTINSTGNSWAATSFAVGTLRLGAHNALPTNLGITIGQVGQTAKLDLAGFNQQIASLADGGGTEIITNSSATADSILTVGSGTFGGCIADSAAGRKTSLKLNGTTFTLAGFNTYSGDTTVESGTLVISGVGDIPNCGVIDLAGGGLDASARYDGTLPLLAGQILKGNGTLAVTGNMANSGTIQLKVTKSGGVVSNDNLAVRDQLSCGGTLKLILTGEALNSTDVLQVFTAGTYAGSIPVIDPAIPAPGATWDTSTLLADGKLRIYGPPMFSTPVLSGTTLTLAGFGGEAFGTFSVVSSTNLAAPAAEWTPVQTGSFDGSGNFSVTVSINPGRLQDFYKLKLP